VFRPLSSDDQAAALGARNTSHWTFSLRPALSRNYARWNGSLVKPG
jgi:hypothetical protein